MARYGNIIMIYDPQGTQLNDITAILVKHKTKFKLHNFTFFVETSSKDNTRAVEIDIASSGVAYAFFHNKNADGSFFKSSLGVSDPVLFNDITKILLE